MRRMLPSNESASAIASRSPASRGTGSTRGGLAWTLIQGGESFGPSAYDERGGTGLEFVEDSEGETRKAAAEFRSRRKGANIEEALCQRRQHSYRTEQPIQGCSVLFQVFQGVVNRRAVTTQESFRLGPGLKP
jgi:hypothetical protein